MKKRLLAIFAALAIAGTSSAFAWGIGAQGGASVGSASVGGAAVTFKTDDLDWVFAADFGFGSDHFDIGVTADYWLGNPEIAGWGWGSFNWFYGVGAAANLRLSDNSYGGFGVGLRALAGLDLFVLDDHLEFYIQAAWQPMIGVWDGDFGFALANFPLNGGFRFWF